MIPTADQTRQQELLMPIADLAPQMVSTIATVISNAISAGRSFGTLPVAASDCELVCRHLRIRGYTIDQVQVNVINPTLENFIIFSW